VSPGKTNPKILTWWEWRKERWNVKNTTVNKRSPTRETEKIRLEKIAVRASRPGDEKRKSTGAAFEYSQRVTMDIATLCYGRRIGDVLRRD